MVVEEVARSCPHPINEKTGFLSQQWILKEQIRRELEAGCLHPNRTVISDRTTLDHIAYIHNSTMSEVEMDILKKTAGAWGHTYDIIFYIRPDERIPLVKDGVRSIDKDFQMKVASTMDVLAGIYRRMGCNIYELGGTTEQRADEIEQIMREERLR